MVTAKKMVKKGLGRGLESLLGEDKKIDDLLKENHEKQPLTSLPLSQLQAGQYQPRSMIAEQELNDLVQSIKSEGVMQPILVRPLDNKKNTPAYEIIAGERRFRAAKLAGLKEIPALIKPVDDQKAAIMALIENIQRENLNPIEEARGVQRLINEFDFTHEQAALAIGRSRSLTSNLLRLLNLSDPVQAMVLNKQIDMGHARALLALDSAEQIIVANQVIAKQLSVRETEKLVTQTKHQVSKKANTPAKKSGDIQRVEEKLSDYLGTKVELKMTKKSQGQLVIAFHDWEHLNDLLDKQGLSDILKVE